MKVYRKNGAIGAILDEYENALEDLKRLVSSLTEHELTAIVDPASNDEDCRSIQTILAHVVSSGLNYAIRIRQHHGESIAYSAKIQLPNTEAYMVALDAMFAFNVKLFEDYPDMVLEEVDQSKKMLTRWGQLYDAEQLMEHAIVHILRHRRQIERFLLRLRN